MKPYYEESGITIYHGDCREILPQLPKVDVVVSDIPYGTGWVRGGGAVGEFSAKHDQPEWDVWDLGWMELVSPSAWAIFCPLNRVQFVALPKSAALYYRKTNPRPGGPTREAIVCSPAPWHMGQWEYSAYNGDCPMHPCQKPMGLMLWIVKGMSDVGQTILDPFMGSGSTIVAAKRLNRRAIGVDINEKYCEAATQRLAQGMLDFDESTPHRSDDWLRALGAQDAIKEEVLSSLADLKPL